MNPITEEYIHSRYKELREECLNKIPTKYWKVMPAETVILNKRLSSSLGRAFVSGKIDINHKAYVGSMAYESLDDTIRHELAHVCAPKGEGHGALWKKTAKYFGANPSSRAKDDGKTNSRYNWSLIAIGYDGRKALIKNYTKSPPSRYFTLNHGYSFGNGDPIMEFIKVPYEQRKQVLEK